MNPILAGLIRSTLTLLGLAVTFLPRPLELSLGPCLGRLCLYAAPRRRRIAQDNLRRCLPELGPISLERLLKKNYEHYGLLAMELMHMFSPFPEHYRSYVQRVAVLEGLENWKRAHNKGKGVLFVSGHFANWELMIAAGALQGIPITVITRHLKPKWVHKKVEAARSSAGIKAAYMPDTLPLILRALHKGESIGLAVDQYAPPPMGIPSRFFGAKAYTLAGVGTLAQRYGAAIIPVSQVRDKNGIVHILIEHELSPGDLPRDSSVVTQKLSDKVEEWIRKTPAQWLWVHRRFKNAVWLRLPIVGESGKIET